MNTLIGNALAVEGKDNALKLAAVLLEQDYQVFVQLDDCDIYIVSYTYNDNNRYGGPLFALLDEEEYDMIINHRADAANAAAINTVKELLHEGYLSDEDLHTEN